MTGLEIVAKALVGVAAKPALDKVKRQEKVVALLKSLKLAPKTPPRDFEGLYIYTLVEYCYGKPEPIINFFRVDYIRDAFRKSFETGDPGHLDREAEEIIAWNDETGELGRLDYNFRLEFAGFTAVFNAPALLETLEYAGAVLVDGSLASAALDQRDGDGLPS